MSDPRGADCKGNAGGPRTSIAALVPAPRANASSARIAASLAALRRGRAACSAASAAALRSRSFWTSCTSAWTAKGRRLRLRRMPQKQAWTTALTPALLQPATGGRQERGRRERTGLLRLVGVAATAWLICAGSALTPPIKAADEGCTRGQRQQCARRVRRGGSEGCVPASASWFRLMFSSRARSKSFSGSGSGTITARTARAVSWAALLLRGGVDGTHSH
jgi:hypothetical protein